MLGIEGVRVEMKEARFSCPYPAHAFGDKNPSAYMNLDSTAFICFSCGEQGNAITFLADVKNVTRATAKNWIAQKWAPQFAQIDDLRAFVEGMFERVEQEEEPEPPFVPLAEEEYQKRAVNWKEGQFGFWWEYMIEQRGFDPDILNRFDVCHDPISDRPCLTVRERDGSLVGFKGRAYREDQWPKYMVLGDTDLTLSQRGEIYGFRPYDASRHTFAINIAQPLDRTLIVCEGELNVVAMYQKGFSNVVGPSGSYLSDHVVREIASMCDEVVILLDTDASTIKSYTTAKIKILKAIHAFEPLVNVRVCEDHEGDPAEMNVDSLHRLVNTAVGSTRYRVLHRHGGSVCL
jgi:DNA primase